MEAVNERHKGKILPLPNNAFPIYTNLKEFFVWWCKMLRPFVSLTEKEIDVMANFLYQRHILSKSILDPKVLDTIVMSDEIKNRVIEESKITKQHFYVIMSNLRKRKVIQNGVIASKLIPNIRPTDNGTFQLTILFKGVKEAS